ncbi:uncharacterized protein LOC116804987 [Drosophila grimshawi]|uniref:uncharacterized protein LOC116804987 n=1 Tax=Drosophila grimshawi TaxID=7222 RepID=UPI0013EF3ECC|nr:uncharacterized protein LOC116804987 [Drosophila grimshawi]
MEGSEPNDGPSGSKRQEQMQMAPIREMRTQETQADLGHQMPRHTKKRVRIPEVLPTTESQEIYQPELVYTAPTIEASIQERSLGSMTDSLKKQSSGSERESGLDDNQAESQTHRSSSVSFTMHDTEGFIQGLSS